MELNVQSGWAGSLVLKKQDLGTLAGRSRFLLLAVKMIVDNPEPVLGRPVENLLSLL